MKSAKWNAVSGRIETALDLPAGTVSAAPRMELVGNRRIWLEGCQSILEYDEDTVRLRTTLGEVRISGSDLCMTCRTPEHAVITGHLLSVEFL